ncbi:MAG: phosphoribosyl-AMP cyclohydrolase [Rickettsiales bacterium]|mgnify:CR=1 FL=1|nr:phosphoribosyl-AMP cyclohydrolase [Rickettsiales bacterium]OUV79574.1 MAG: phosphoribosyl-AMP cyclohydrolase [Rickettsiales bacterium TMED131]|tara:strand:+ start:4770 stop:5264 length:495 start_codon:yes stop_codon:yes gene_type:complete
MIDINKIVFEQRNSIKQIEEGNMLCPKFNDKGLLPCITVENNTNQVLMFSYLNTEALKKSILTKKAHYYSRSRKNIWIKGETSGMTHDIKEIFIDDDQDCIIFIVSLNKPDKGGNIASCHVGYKSCFYRRVKLLDNKIHLEFTEHEKAFDPKVVYKGIDNPTKI